MQSWEKKEFTHFLKHYPFLPCAQTGNRNMNWIKKNVPNNWHVSSDERKTGLEPATPTLGRSCSTNWATFAFKSERKTGLEPATLTLARLCSTNWAIFAFTIPIKNSSVGYSQLRCKSNTFFLKAKKIREIFPASRMKSLKRPSPLVFCHIFRNFDTLN